MCGPLSEASRLLLQELSDKTSELVSEVHELEGSAPIASTLSIRVTAVAAALENALEALRDEGALTHGKQSTDSGSKVAARHFRVGRSSNARR